LQDGFVGLRGGTVLCLPPEAFNNTAPVSGKHIDYWGLAVVLYELTNDDMPFERLKPDDVNVKQVLSFQDMRPYEEHCSVDARYLISRMLALEAEKRPSLKEMVEEMNWLKDEEDPRVRNEMEILRNRLQ
jgi:serine/threonine protein kinase